MHSAALRGHCGRTVSPTDASKGSKRSSSDSARRARALASSSTPESCHIQSAGVCDGMRASCSVATTLHEAWCGGTRRVRLVREGGTRRVQSVREGGGAHDCLIRRCQRPHLGGSRRPGPSVRRARSMPRPAPTRPSAWMRGCLMLRGPRRCVTRDEPPHAAQGVGL
jgi:hypothetical protein